MNTEKRANKTILRLSGSLLVLALSSPAAFADLGGAIGGLGDTIGGTVGGVVGGAGNVVDDLGDGLNGADNDGAGGLGDGLGNAVGGDLGGAVDGAVDGVGDILNGGSTGSTPSGTTPTNPESPTLGPDPTSNASMPGTGVQGTPRCAVSGNSTAYNGYTVVDRRGHPLGLVQDALVDSSLSISRVRFMANGNVTGSPVCVEFSSGNISIHSGQVRLPISQSDIARANAGQ